MKYTIRYQPDVPGIETAHWMIWRPGEYQRKTRGCRAFAKANSFDGAIRVVERDIDEAQVRFYQEFFKWEPAAAILWWALRCSKPESHTGFLRDD